MAKDLVPIVIGAAVWGPLLSQKRIELQCNNQGLVSAINKWSAKDPIVMHLLCCLWFFTACFDIDATAIHIAGKSNEAADMLSRNWSKDFLRAHPQASQFPTLLPSSLLNLISPQQLDWTSPSFLHLFQDTISAIQRAAPHNELSCTTHTQTVQ